MKILITGGAGFIGSALIRFIYNHTNDQVINVDKLTYAGNLHSLGDIALSNRYFFEQIDICDAEKLEKVFEKHSPDCVMHLAAESHVDRSIDSPSTFIQTNVIGTFNLLMLSKQYWQSLNGAKKLNFRFHHISTDEVYGDLENENDFFKENTPYAPSSPYSASKASSDHLVRAWLRTYGLPTLITNCSNNYGPYQFPEKLIPLTILNAIENKNIPIYGTGNQIRDWLFVDDHVRALYLVLTTGKVGETYNIGGLNEKRNIDVVKEICSILDEILKDDSSKSLFSDLITFVQDRPGHDKRYAIDSSKIKRELGWQPLESFETGIRKTVEWYLNNNDWVLKVKDGTYRTRYGLGENQ